jgi:hypothetical protein
MMMPRTFAAERRRVRQAAAEDGEQHQTEDRSGPDPGQVLRPNSCEGWRRPLDGLPEGALTAKTGTTKKVPMAQAMPIGE